MKVLLLGEYSGFFYNLKMGLKELGVDVTLLANGDAWKQIPGADGILYKDGDTNPFKKLYNKIIIPELTQKNLSGYDVVQLIIENVYSPYINSHLIKNIKKNNGKLFVSIPGNHPTLYQSWKNGTLKYYTYDDNPDKYFLFEDNSLRNKLYQKSVTYIDSIADGIIPIMYEYAVGVRNLPNCKATIPLPFNYKEIEYKENKINQKVFFYHGLLRPKDKGSQYIIEALEILKKKYPNDVDICIADTLPLKEYLKVIEKTNVLVDQCKEHCWGMNACYAMAMGKVVMGGASRNSLKEFNLDSSPIIHIMPNVNQIVQQLEYILDNKAQIPQWGQESRHFVESFHDSKRIAQLYLDTWTQ